MKTILMIMLMLFSITITAQITPCNNARLNYLQQKDSLNLYESDELVVLQAECREYQKQEARNKTSPCEEPLLKSLQQKDSLTTYEVELYIRLLDRCNEYTNKQYELQLAADRNAAIKNYTLTYAGVALVSTIIIYLIYANAYH